MNGSLGAVPTYPSRGPSLQVVFSSPFLKSTMTRSRTLILPGVSFRFGAGRARAPAQSRKERLSCGRATRRERRCHVALSGVLGDDLLVERGDLAAIGLPAIAFPGVRSRLPARRRRSSSVVAAWPEPLPRDACRRRVARASRSAVADDSAGPCASQATTRQPHAIASIRASPEHAPDRGNTSRSPAFSAPEAARAAASRRGRTLRASRPADRFERMLRPPTPPDGATSTSGKSRPSSAWACRCAWISSGRPLDGGETGPGRGDPAAASEPLRSCVRR